MSNIAKVRILDEVNVVIVGLHPDHIALFYDLYARNSPNFFFNPKFKIGAWDGKIRYFHKTGKTYVYLLDELIPKIVSLGYRIEIIDNRQSVPVQPEPITDQYFAHILHPENNEPIVLRHYQVTGANSLFKAGNGVAIAGTGGGKTLTCAAIADVYNKLTYKVLVIVPSQDLITQTKEEFEIVELDVGEYSGDSKDINHATVISTWQALKNNPLILKEFGVVIVDECLAGDTLITMHNGITKQIKNIATGDMVLTYNQNINEFESNKVTCLHQNLLVSSCEEMYRLEFDNDTFIEITGNHKIMTTNGYIRADQLTTKDEIISLFDRET